MKQVFTFWAICFLAITSGIANAKPNVQSPDRIPVLVAKLDSIKAALAKADISKEEKSKLLNYQALIYIRSLKDSSMLLSKKALAFAEQNKLSIKAIEATYLIGRAFMKADKLDSASALLNAALLSAIKQKNAWLESEIRLNIVQQLYRRKQYDLALRYIDQVIKQKELLKDYSGLGSAYIVKAYVYGMNGSFEQTMAYNYQGLKLVQQYGDGIGLQNIYNNIAIVFLNAKKADSALRYCNLALFTVERNGINSSRINIELNLGETYYALNKPKQGNEHFSKSLEIAYEYGDKREILEALSIITEYSAEASLINEIKKALGYCASDEDIEYRAKLHGLLATTYEKQGKFSEAFTAILAEDSLSALAYKVKQESLIKEQDEKFQAIKQERELKAEIESASQKEYEAKLYLIAAVVLASVLLIIGYQFRRMRLAKADLDKLYAKLEIQNKELANINDTKDRLYSILAHDLRGPIHSYNQLPQIMNWMIDSRNQAGLLNLAQQMKSSTEQISSLLENLLTWSISQSGEISVSPGTLKLKDIVEEILQAYSQNLILKGIEVRILIADDISVYADRATFSVAVRNLVSNAIKYSPKTGGAIEIAAVADAKQVKLSIKDNGIGMSREMLSKLFTPDKTKNRSGTGGEKSNGLGLMLVKDMLKLNNATVSAESEEGNGTCFTLRIPLYKS